MELTKEQRLAIGVLATKVASLPVTQRKMATFASKAEADKWMCDAIAKVLVAKVRKMHQQGKPTVFDGMMNDAASMVLATMKYNNQ